MADQDKLRPTRPSTPGRFTSPGAADRLSRRDLLRRAAALGLTTVAADALLIACGGGAATPPGAAGQGASKVPPGVAKKDPVELTMFVWVGGNQGVVPREVIADYMKVMKDPVKAKAAGMIIPTQEVCVGCHSKESPTFKGFDYAAYLAKGVHKVPKETKK